MGWEATFKAPCLLAAVWFSASHDCQEHWITSPLSTQSTHQHQSKLLKLSPLTSRRLVLLFFPTATSRVSVYCCAFFGPLVNQKLGGSRGECLGFVYTRKRAKIQAPILNMKWSTEWINNLNLHRTKGEKVATIWITLNIFNLKALFKKRDGVLI